MNWEQIILVRIINITSACADTRLPMAGNCLNPFWSWLICYDSSFPKTYECITQRVHFWSRCVYESYIALYDVGVYAASKAGLEAGSDALRVELAHKQVSSPTLQKHPAWSSFSGPCCPSRPGLHTWAHSPSQQVYLHPTVDSHYFHVTPMFEWDTVKCEYSGKEPIMKPWVPRGVIKKSWRNSKSSPTYSQTTSQSLAWRLLN